MDQKRKGSDSKGARGGSASALDKAGHVKPDKLAENQRRLNVGPDHRTPEMKKGHRGTFP
jgi:hypothetical protein